MICNYNTNISVKLGINSALLASYINYRLNDRENKSGWVKISYKQLMAIFPFMGKTAVKNALRRLLRENIIKQKQLDKSKFDFTYSYSITMYGKTLLEEEEYIE